MSEVSITITPRVGNAPDVAFTGDGRMLSATTEHGSLFLSWIDIGSDVRVEVTGLGEAHVIVPFEQDDGEAHTQEACGIACALYWSMLRAAGLLEVIPK